MYDAQRAYMHVLVGTGCRWLPRTYNYMQLHAELELTASGLKIMSSCSDPCEIKETRATPFSQVHSPASIAKLPLVSVGIVEKLNPFCELN